MPGSSLDQPQASNTLRYFKTLDVTDMTRPSLKTAVENLITKGWIPLGNPYRALNDNTKEWMSFTRTEDE